MSTNTLERLCDPDVHSLSAAIKQARKMKDLDPLLDVTLAQMIPPKIGEPSGYLEGVKLERALEILDAVSKGGRILNRVVHLMEHSSERIRSKAALLIGRRVGGVHWSKKAQSDPNHRVRANVIEALWDGPEQQSREMFYRALRDSDFRVVGNAVYGIYRLCPAEGVPLIAAMAAHPQAGRRRTAAWLMGKTEDLQFRPLLQTMIRDPEARVRSVALGAMFAIKRAHETHGSANAEILNGTASGAPCLSSVSPAAAGRLPSSPAPPLK